MKKSANPADTVEHWDIERLIPYARNSRTHSEAQIAQIAASMKEWGVTSAVLVDEDGGIIAGHGRVLAARKLGKTEMAVMIARGWTDAQKKAYVIADNQLALNAGWDKELLKLELDELHIEGFKMDLLGFDAAELSAAMGLDDLAEQPCADGVVGSMAANFGQPPFSVLDTRKGDWLQRKRQWHAMIGDSGESRQGTLASDSIMSELNSGVSILDPVMSEIIVKWFGLAGGVAFDPFAGDSVFGYVSAHCGMRFQGIELRLEQAELNQNRVQAAGLDAVYHTDSSENMDAYIADESVDLVFSCPPYADLEVYSDDPKDLSNMSHGDFFAAYKAILQKTYSKLKENRFAVIVMGEVRAKNGAYIGTIPKTIEIMESAGYQYYNEIVLINSAGTLPLRAGKSIRASRKVGKMHQNIMVFLKGDAARAAKALGEIQAPTDFEGAPDE